MKTLVPACLLVVLAAGPARARPCPQDWEACHTHDGAAFVMPTIGMPLYLGTSVGRETLAGMALSAGAGYRTGRLTFLSSFETIPAGDGETSFMRMGLAVKWSLVEWVTSRHLGTGLYAEAGIGRQYVRWYEGEEVVRTLERPDAMLGAGVVETVSVLAPLAYRLELGGRILGAPRPRENDGRRPEALGTDLGLEILFNMIYEF